MATEVDSRTVASGASLVTIPPPPPPILLDGVTPIGTGGALPLFLGGLLLVREASCFGDGIGDPPKVILVHSSFKARSM